MKKLLLGSAIGCAGLILIAVVVGFLGLFYIGLYGPSTSVVSGEQMRKAHAKIVRDLGLIEESEKILYFYSDALMDPRDGFYLVTETTLALYSDHWDEPALVTPLSSIVDLDAEFEDSWMLDSNFIVTLEDGTIWTFPVSTEKELDHKFHDHIAEHMRQPLPAEADASVN